MYAWATALSTDAGKTWTFDAYGDGPLRTWWKLRAFEDGELVGRARLEREEIVAVGRGWIDTNLRLLRTFWRSGVVEIHCWDCWRTGVAPNVCAQTRLPPSNRHCDNAKLKSREWRNMVEKYGSESYSLMRWRIDLRTPSREGTLARSGRGVQWLKNQARSWPIIAWSAAKVRPDEEASSWLW